MLFRYQSFIFLTPLGGQSGGGLKNEQDSAGACVSALHSSAGLGSLAVHRYTLRCCSLGRFGVIECEVSSVPVLGDRVSYRSCEMSAYV